MLIFVNKSQPILSIIYIERNDNGLFTCSQLISEYLRLVNLDSGYYRFLHCIMQLFRKISSLKFSNCHSFWDPHREIDYKTSGSQGLLFSHTCVYVWCVSFSSCVWFSGNSHSFTEAPLEDKKCICSNGFSVSASGEDFYKLTRDPASCLGNPFDLWCILQTCTGSCCRVCVTWSWKSES